MKIACIGNMNNTFFTIVRYLRDRGIDAELLLTNYEISYFLPFNDTFDFEYKQYTKQLYWGMPKTFLFTSSKKIKSDLMPFDFIMARSATPAFIEKAGRNIDLYVPYGGDIGSMPFLFETGIKGVLNFLFKIYQKKGIQNSFCINTQYFHSVFKKKIEKLKILHKTHYFGVPQIYNKIFSNNTIEQYYNKSKWYPEFKKVRDKFDLVVFHQSRHVWNKSKRLKKNEITPYCFKGNDILIKGFSKFVKDKPQVNACLVLFEYSRDFLDSKKLISELGIENNVRWFPVMPRKELLIGMSLFDISTGDFDIGWTTSGVIEESLAMGKPMLHYLDSEVPVIEGVSDYPFVNVQTASDIYNTLKDYCSYPSHYKKIGIDAGEWYDKYYVRKSIDKFVELINAKERGENITEVVRKWEREI